MTDIKEKRQTGYIYSIRSYHTDGVYVGSTFGTLRQRLYQHKIHFKAFQNKTHHYVSSFEIVKHEDAYIELVETYENVNKMELQRHEGECIRRTEKCVNKRIEGRTREERNNENIEKIKEYNKEYNKKNAEHIKEYYKEYKKDNAEHIKEQAKEKYICSCGKSLSTGHKSRHDKVCKNKILIME